jgi:hypothetical protein
MKGTSVTVDKKGMTFLIERFGRDCGDLQYVREFTQNSIDAITRAGIADGLITWEVDERYMRETGVRKLAISDNGDGMTGEEMVQHIGRLSSSGQEQSLQGNYGLGAKISAATRNQHGLLYLSWRNGRGAVLRLHKHAGEYEIERTDLGNGLYREWRDLDASEKPATIDDHGTRVVLLGQSAEDDTSRPPGKKVSHKWLLLYLNRRYFRLPENVEIRVEVARDPKDTNGGRDMRRVQGQGAFLDKHATMRGCVRLRDANAHWWILPAPRDEGGELPDTSEFERSGHVSALYQDELYELQNGRAGQVRLQSFGVVFGCRRVVLYVEPTACEMLTTNTARTTLILGGEPLPWTDWAAEFRERLPPEIRTLEEEASAGAVDRERTKSVEKTLEDLVKLYRLSRYVGRENGSETFDADAEDGGGGPSVESPECAGSRPSMSSSSSRPSARHGGRDGSLVYGRRRNEGERGDAQQSTDFPTIVWKSDSPGPGERPLDPEELIDRAARYVAESNILFVNRDFNAFIDLEDHVVKLFRDRPGARNVIRAVMKRWIEVHLSEVVAGARSLRSREQWTREHFQTAVSEEALTAAVMPRYHLVFAIKREVGTKVGGM